MDLSLDRILNDDDGLVGRSFGRMIYSISNHSYLTRDYPQSLETGRGKQLLVIILQHVRHVSAFSTNIEEKGA